MQSHCNPLLNEQRGGNSSKTPEPPQNLELQLSTGMLLNLLKLRILQCSELQFHFNAVCNVELMWMLDKSKVRQ
jgi:hypothetical protein